MPSVLPDQPPPAAPLCTACDAPIDGARLDDPRTGRACHPACLGERLSQDAFVALLAAAGLVLAPAVVVWAG
jgi:hypothetical protein